MNKCQPLALGIAVGVLWAVSVFLAGLFAMFGWGAPLVETLGSLYIGYGTSTVGAIIGAIWGFIDGFVAGVVVAWIYNLVTK